MIKRRLVATVLVAGTLSFPAPALADHRGEPVYNIIYYSDSTHSQEVGSDTGNCRSWGVEYMRSGQWSAYSHQEIAYWCEDGVWYPHH